MKQRHKLQRQRPRPASAKRRVEAYEEAKEHQQPSSSKAKRRPTYQGQAEGGRTKRRLDKFRRGSRPKRFAGGGAADPGAPLSLNPADYANVGMNGQGQWVNSNTGKLLDQPPPLSDSGLAYMRQAARNPSCWTAPTRLQSPADLRPDSPPVAV
jgi:hypothetical protein